MANINLTVKSNFEDASRDMKGFSELTETELKRIQKALSKVKGQELDSFIQRNQRAANAVKATRGPVEALGTEAAGLRRKIEMLIRNGMDPMSDELKTLRNEYIKVNAQIEKNNLALKANQQAAKFASQGLKVMAVATAAVTAAGVKMSIDYTKSLANVNTMIDMTAGEMKQLDKEITSVSNAFAIQKKELSAGVYQALSAGAEDLNEAMEIVTESAKLGKGALIENAASVDIVTTAMNAYASEALTAAEVSDTYFQIIKKGKINGEQLSQTIGQSISLFSAAKIPIDDLGAGIASLTKVGVQASEATTQLNGIVNAFLKPSAAMSKALEEAGVASGSLLLEQEGLGGAIEFLNKVTGGNIDKMAELVPNIRGMRGAVALASNDMATYNEVAASFTDKTGAADEAMKKQTEGFAAAAFTVEQSVVMLQNFVETLGGKVLPVLGTVANGLNNFMQNEEKMKKATDILLASLGALAVGLAGVLAFTKGAAIIQGLATAFRALNAAIAANPIGAIAVVITTILIPAIILLVRNWDTVVITMQTTLEKLKARFEQVGSAIKMSWTVAINGVKIAFLSLGTIIFEKIMPAINTFLDLAGKLPFVGEKFQNLQSSVNDLAADLTVTKDAAIENSRETIAAAKAENAAVQESIRGRITAINEESAARKAALEEQEAMNETAKEQQLAMVESIKETEAEITAIKTEALMERLAVLNDLEAQQRLEDQEAFTEFLNGRMEQEQVTGEQRIEFLRKELQRIKKLETISYKEKLRAEKQVNKMIAAEEKKQADFRKALLKAQLQDYANFFGSVGDLITAAGGKNRAAAITAKVLAHAQAGINSALAFTAALAQAPWPLNLAAAGSVLAAGVAQQINIAKTPIPSAQTGTGPSGIVVPESTGTQRQDNVAVMAQPGETVNVTPRGQTAGGGTITAQFVMNDEVLAEATNRLIESGDIRITQENIQGGQTVA